MPGFFTHLSRSVRRRWADRSAFRAKRDWFLVLYDTMVRYFPALPLPGRNRSRPVAVAGLDHPIQIRLGSADGAVVEEVFVRGVYDPAVGADPQNVRTVIDLGANVGISVRFWLQKFPAARVIAVEPSELNFRALQNNVGHDNRRVTLVRACVAERSGHVFLHTDTGEAAYKMSQDPVARGESVPAISMEDLLRDHLPVGDIDLLKCDIEGAEARVFQHCAAWIHRVRNVAIELHPPYTADDLLRSLADAGVNFRLVSQSATGDNPLLYLTRV